MSSCSSSSPPDGVDDESAALKLHADHDDHPDGARIVPAAAGGGRELDKQARSRRGSAGYGAVPPQDAHFTSYRVKSGPDLLRVVDSLLALHVIAPLTISCWRGLWETFGLFPEAYPPWAQAALGAVMHTVLALTRDLFMRTFDCRRYPEPGRSLVKPAAALAPCPQVATRCYTWVFAVACISHWRGTWFLLDELGVDATTVAFVWTVAALLMLCTRSLRNTMAPPLVIGTDGPDYCFSFPHMFRSDVSTAMMGR
ncbi:Protein penguin [Frankliniella fusca]|uniref:Protein penguin n=1 Tax=Frankliniella fusca TaxID=407009 RepID=A0AAE1L746_9NEOP|nr:Protein penguin [Frankliniella fusca]